MKANAQSLITQLLTAIGDDPSRAGLQETPTRVVSAWDELFCGYNKKRKPMLTVFENGADGITYDEMIIDHGTFFSHCEHHMLPFFGTYHFAYIPHKHIIGLSKIGRVIAYHSARLQIQERLVHDVVHEIQNAIKPKGIGLVLRARHLCREMRGARNVGSSMETNELHGRLKTDPATRAEFMRTIPNQKGN